MTQVETPPETETDIVLYEVEGPVAYVTMNRPRYRNAQNNAMTYALDDAFSKAAADDDVRVIVLQGSGDHFSAGHDLGTPGADHDKYFDKVASMWWDRGGKEGADGRVAREQEVYLGMCRRWRELPKPTIAKVQGACVAGGLALAWACDLMIASEDAFFADIACQFDQVGIEYWAHPWQMSPRFAKEMLFMARRVTAAEAHQWGMVNRVVPRDQLDEEVRAVAGRIGEMTRFGLAIAKQAVNHAEDLMGLRMGMEHGFYLHQLAHSYAGEKGEALDPTSIRKGFKSS